eukprot:XP_001705613.1 Hypothetical protein GL50803_34516 [Giardia lamblia ATCC 50803]
MLDWPLRFRFALCMLLVRTIFRIPCCMHRNICK